MEIFLFAAVGLHFEKEKLPAVLRFFALQRTVPQHVRKQAPTIRGKYFLYHRIAFANVVGENSNNGTKNLKSMK